jgi:hypothetical protein
MSLSGMQTALGRVVRARGVNAETSFEDLDLTPSERACVARVLASPGFRLVTGIQRSWCEGRAIKGAKFTLALLPAEERDRLVREWVDRGGGTNSFFFAEADAFLGFLADRLDAFPHAFSFCQFERAVLRAAAASREFRPPDLVEIKPSSQIGASSSAALVRFFAEPALLLAAAYGKAELPSLASEAQTVLVAPRLTGIARQAQQAEESLWHALGSPTIVAELERRGHARDTITQFLGIGAAELW